MLKGVSVAKQAISNDGNVIFIFKEDEEDDLEILTYPTATKALAELFRLERDHPGSDIVLVKGDRPDYVREAFKNYFSDAEEFIRLVEDGCARLLGSRMIVVTAEALGTDE